ncbi:hypothetical protein WKW79_33815 [Variovorax robiniae]|uniref:Uncharacterized protein n=1 Tax=Variovorax robiniae TaxID=1836199 RepID=A0ABU8XKG3_9BURK
MATTRRVRKAAPELELPGNEVSQVDFISLLHKRAVHELVIVEFAPNLYRIEAIIAWRTGRWTLAGWRGPRNFRTLETLVRHLKTMGATQIVTRLELLP